MGKRIRMPLYFLFSSALVLGIVAFPIFKSTWHRNQTSLAFLHAIDLQSSILDLHNRLYLKPGRDANTLAKLSVDSCQALWLSRIYALKNLQQAEHIVAEADSCTRTTFVHHWQGQLAWQSGNPALAIKYWQSLTPESLVQWGYSLVLAGDIQIGKTLLHIAEQQGRALSTSTQVLLYKTLGDLAQQEREMGKAVSYYEKTWVLSNYNYKIAYHLGTIFAQQGNCERAIEVWEKGMANKPDYDEPQLDASYLIQWADCEVTLDHLEQAEAKLALAQRLIDRYNLVRHQNWIERVRNRLEEQRLP